MSENISFELNVTSLLAIPFHLYDDDFTFIVNDQEFKTCRLIAHLLSPKIIQNQISDPTNSQFVIKTRSKGNFQSFLDIFKNQQIHFPASEKTFIEEVINILGNTSFTFHHPQNSSEATLDNIFNQLSQNLTHPVINSHLIQENIDFISSHFYEFKEEDLIEKFRDIEIEYIEKVLDNSKLRLDTEDQLISFVNKLYSIDTKFSTLYEFINYNIISEVEMTNFLSIFNIDDLTTSTWRKISERLLTKIALIDPIKSNRYCRFAITRFLIQMPYCETFAFNGIINCLIKNYKENSIEITSSQPNNNFVANNVILYNDVEKSFSSSGENTFICFDFKDFRVIPKNYSIRSWKSGKNCSHPRGWVIEGSNDNNKFEIIDEQRDCPLLNGISITHTFDIENPQNKSFKFLRIRSIMPDWHNTNNLDIDSIEFYGGLTF